MYVHVFYRQPWGLWFWYMPTIVVPGHAHNIFVLIVKILFIIVFIWSTINEANLGGTVGCPSDWWWGGYWFDPLLVQQYLCRDWSWNIIYGIVSLLVIQEGQLSGEKMLPSTLYWLTKSVTRSAWPWWVDKGVKPQHKQTTSENKP